MRWLSGIPKLDHQFSLGNAGLRCILNARRVFEVQDRCADRIGSCGRGQAEHRQQKRA
jgi:hypothetical protein